MGEELNLGKAFICVGSNIGTEKEKWHEVEIKSFNSTSGWEKPESSKPFTLPKHFELTATVEPTRSLNKLLGVYRKNRGSSRSFWQKVYRTRYYLVRTKQSPSMYVKYTWKGIHIRNEINRMFRDK